MPDVEIKRLLKMLEEAINRSLSDSDRVNEAVRRIDEAGYEAFLILDATIGLNRKGKGEAETVSQSPAIEDAAVRLRITSDDAKFLKSLKIAVDSEN
jgi:hypothetical protein